MFRADRSQILHADPRPALDDRKDIGLRFVDRAPALPRLFLGVLDPLLEEDRAGLLARFVLLEQLADVEHVDLITAEEGGPGAFATHDPPTRMRFDVRALGLALERVRIELAGTRRQ
jgi:hypothetical protein